LEIPPLFWPVNLHEQKRVRLIHRWERIGGFERLARGASNPERTQRATTRRV
jgi:hypothetical protein